jgi:hypothetical protein
MPASDNSPIFARLIEDHDRHRELLDQLKGASGAQGQRGKLLEELTKELKGHAAAEEQALYSTMLRKPATTADTRHSVAEHHEIEEMLNDLAASEAGSAEWTTKFEALDHRYRHHIDEEEEEHFPEFTEHLDENDMTWMRSVFDKRKKEEKAAAQVTPEKMEEAKE